VNRADRLVRVLERSQDLDPRALRERERVPHAAELG
jgi:hypothetical protein